MNDRYLDKEESRADLNRETIIHEAAEVSGEAEIGRGCRIGPRAVIGPEVEMDRNCRIGPGARLTAKINMGPENTVESGAVLKGGCKTENHDAGAGNIEDGQAGITMGEKNIIREYAIVEGGGVKLGDENFLMAYTTLKPGVKLKSRIKIANMSVLGPEVKVGTGAFIAGICLLTSGIEVGKLAMLGGHSRFEQDIPPFMLADGKPARIHSINAVGLRRDGIDREEFSELKEIFREVFRGDSAEAEKTETAFCIKSMKERIDGLERRDYTGDYALELLTFLKEKESIMPGKGESG